MEVVAWSCHVTSSARAVAWRGRGGIQFEERVRDLQHQDVWVVVLVTDQDALAGSAHAMFFVVLFQSLETRVHRRIFFRLVLFGAKGVVAEREKADGWRLVCVE